MSGTSSQSGAFCLVALRPGAKGCGEHTILSCCPDWGYRLTRSGGCHWSLEGKRSREWLQADDQNKLKRPETLQLPQILSVVQTSFLLLTVSTQQATSPNMSGSQCHVCKLGRSGFLKPLFICTTCHEKWHSFCHKPPILTFGENSYVHWALHMHVVRWPLHLIGLGNVIAA